MAELQTSRCLSYKLHDVSVTNSVIVELQTRQSRRYEHILRYGRLLGEDLSEALLACLVLTVFAGKAI